MISPLVVGQEVKNNAHGGRMYKHETVAKMAGYRF